MKARTTLLILLLLGYNYVISQDISNPSNLYVDYNNLKLPETPNGASIGSYGDVQVNPSTGVPGISIPIYTLEIDGVQIPISLTYDASGVKVAELGSAVGLNWKLNAGGGVFRTVQTKPDEDWWLDGKGYIPDSFYDIFDPQNYSHQTQLELYAKNRDHNPDIFSYNFLGYSGSYIRDIDGTIAKFKEDQLFIHDHTTIDDYQGNLYLFGEVETSKNFNKTIANDTDILNVDWQPHDTGWLLTKIITKNNKQIHFEYKEVDLEYAIIPVSNTIELSKDCITNPENNYVPKKTTTRTDHEYTMKLIEKIKTDGIEIFFDYITDTNLADEFQEKLSSITITDLITGNQKKFILEHGYFAGDPRLKLEDIYEVDANDNPLPGYSFEYESGSLPAKNTTAQDFFGYSNGKGGATLVHKSQTAINIFDAAGEIGYLNDWAGDRSLGESYLKRGVLTKMVYPTGGSTVFDYAANTEGNRYCGGLRVNKITNWDTDGTTKLSERTYQYSGLVGHDPIEVENDLELTYNMVGNTWNFASGFIDRPDIYSSGYFYKNVTIITKSVSGTETFKEEHTYEDYNGEGYHYRNPFTNYEGLLKEKRIYKGSQLIKIEEYQYDTFGDQYSFSWFILGDRICWGALGFEQIGYSTGIEITVDGNTTKLPVQVATTDYLPGSGSGVHPVTTLKTLTYNDYLQPLEEVIDYRKIRVVDGNGNVSYDINDANAEKLTISYTYPNDYSLSLPKALPISKIIHSKNESKTIFGQYFVYDSDGNIQKTFHYNKGVGSNTFGSYVPSDYEEKTGFVFLDGNPVQVQDKDGRPVSYIWGYHSRFIVAKIENRYYSTIPGGLIDDIVEKSEDDNESQLITALNALRNYSGLAGAMITTYTYRPLYGVSTITDAKGYKTTYHYDSFGRLEYVTDAQGKKLEEYEYHYESE